MNEKEVIKLLRENETPFLETKTFSKHPGIYAFFFIGTDFPVLGNSVSKHDIIYIGKTESSQEKRDAKTHFTSGKTGSSTVRKSIGSLLFDEMNLKPIPRNQVDYEKGRFSHFRFDMNSEEKVTEWMKNNFALSFYEYHGSKQEIENLEIAIIKELIPILNISNNPSNTFKSTLKRLRKNCASLASNNFIPNEVNKAFNIVENNKSHTSMSTSGKYINLWTRQRATIEEKIKKAYHVQSIQLNSEEFRKVGNRKNYSFNLEFKNGIVSNNIGGSAVARDLASVLETSSEIMETLNRGHFKISMDKQFRLNIIQI